MGIFEAILMYSGAIVWGIILLLAIAWSTGMFEVKRDYEGEDGNG